MSWRQRISGWHPMGVSGIAWTLLLGVALLAGLAPARTDADTAPATATRGFTAHRRFWTAAQTTGFFEGRQ